MVRAESETLSPERAAQLAGCSRFAIMRALKAQRLQGFRDNRNRWQIERSEVERWAADRGASGEREQVAAHAETVVLEGRLLMAEARADAAERARDVAEADRDHWRQMAGDLARRRRWWPW